MILNPTKNVSFFLDFVTTWKDLETPGEVFYPTIINDGFQSSFKFCVITSKYLTDDTKSMTPSTPYIR